MYIETDRMVICNFNMNDISGDGDMLLNLPIVGTEEGKKFMIS